MSKDTLDIVGIGNAIVDVLAKTGEDFLAQHQIEKGAMTLIEMEQAEALYKKMPPATAVSGGSVANTIAAFAAMGGKAGYIGKVASDQLGEVFRHDMRASGVTFDTPPLQDGPSTARCFIFVTPDAQRTMCTYLGACVWISPTDLNEELIKTAKVTYLEGYLLTVRARNRHSVPPVKWRMPPGARLPCRYPIHSALTVTAMNSWT
jgi:sugar/nucleoside kinase (ribokinase family)